jgi:hypothetical protein
VGQPIEDRGRRVFRDGQYRQHGAAVTVGAQNPSSAENEFAVLPQNLQLAFRRSAEPNG